MLISNIHYLRLFNSHSYTYLHSEHDTCGKKRYVVFRCVRVCVLSICVSCIMTKKNCMLLWFKLTEYLRKVRSSEFFWSTHSIHETQYNLTLSTNCAFFIYVTSFHWICLFGISKRFVHFCLAVALFRC